MKRQIHLFSLTIFCFSLFSYCSSWKKSNLGMEASWSNSEDLLVYSIEFEETSAWNPLEGTTIKRNFSTLLKEYKLKSDNQLVPVSEFQFPFWVLNNNVFYNSKNRNIFIMRGSSEGYGTSDRTISNYLIDEKKTIDIWTGKPGEFLWKIVPSPDSSHIAFITTGSPTTEMEAKLHIWNAEKGIRSIPIPAWIDSSFEYGISWNSDSRILYLAVRNEVYTVNVIPKELTPTRAGQFPKCFVPSTNFGFRISKEGKYIEGNPLDPKKITISEKKDFLDYSKISKTNIFQNQKCNFSF